MMPFAFPYARPTAKPMAPDEAPAVPPRAGGSRNPLLHTGAALLRIGARVRTVGRHPDPEKMKARLMVLVRDFEAACKAIPVPDEQIVAARYILCAFLDESVLSTTWGAASQWSQHSLLIAFYQEGWGGEKVFRLGARLCEKPARYIDVLELLYVVLSIGFEGRYRIRERGREELDGVRERLSRLLRQNGRPFDRELSKQWKAADAQASRLRDGVALWIVAAAAAFFLLLVFAAMRFSVDDMSEPVFAELEALDVRGVGARGVNTVVAPDPSAAAKVAASPLAALLQSDIDAGSLDVFDMADRSVVTVRGDQFFAEGQAEVADEFKPLIRKVAEAMGRIPGAVLVTGHTDDQPIRSLHYPSNWHLSQERAKAVGALLASRVDRARITTEGRADAEPVGDNSTPAGRARNRRVEITLMTPAATP